MKLVRSPAFVRAAKKLCRTNPELDEDINLTLQLLQREMFHPKLVTHKLKGRHSGVWSCKVAYDTRVLFRFVEEDSERVILLLSVGAHDEVY